MTSARSCTVFRSFALLALTATSALCWSSAPTTAHAQPPHDAGELSLSDDDRSLREQVDRMSSAATVLYAIGAPLHNLGLGVLGWGGAMQSSCFGRPCDDTPNVVMALGGGAAFVGILMVFVGIGLDVGSGRRRRLLEERVSVPQLGLVPRTDGAMATLALSF